MQTVRTGGLEPERDPQEWPPSDSEESETGCGINMVSGQLRRGK